MPVARTQDAWFLDDFYCASIDLKKNTERDFTKGAEWECFGYIEKGSGNFHVGNSVYTVNPGDIIYIRKGTPYKSFWMGNPDIHFYSVGFAFRNAPLSFPLQAISNCADLADDIRNLYNTFAANKLEAMQIFYRLYENLVPRLETVSSFSGKMKQIEKALCYIRRNPEKHISVSELARMCSLSEPHFYTLFKQHMGVTPVQHMNRMRCKEVERLLMHTDMTVEEISDSLGFSSTAFMRRTLKNAIGKTPSEIRKEQRGM